MADYTIDSHQRCSWHQVERGWRAAGLAREAWKAELAVRRENPGPEGAEARIAARLNRLRAERVASRAHRHIGRVNAAYFCARPYCDHHQ